MCIYSLYLYLFFLFVCVWRKLVNGSIELSQPPQLLPASSKNNQKQFNTEVNTQWYCCAVCGERLFKAVHIVGSMGMKSELQQQMEQHQQQFNPYLPEHRFFIVDWSSSDVKLRTDVRYCTENIGQYASYCPTCYMFLNAPVQAALAGAAAPKKRRHFRHYKRFIKLFSATYQVIRTYLVDLEVPSPQF